MSYLELPNDVDITGITLEVMAPGQTSLQHIYTGITDTISRGPQVFRGTLSLHIPNSASKSFTAFMHALNGGEGRFKIPLPRNRFAPRNHPNSFVHNYYISKRNNAPGWVINWHNNNIGTVSYLPYQHDWININDRLHRIVDVIDVNLRVVELSPVPTSGLRNVEINYPYVIARVEYGSQVNLPMAGSLNDNTTIAWMEAI